MKKALMLTLSLTLALSTTAITAAPETHGTDSHGETAGHDSHAGHDRHLSIFYGATTTLDAAPHNYFTVGLDYERKLFDGVAGIGVLFDVATDGSNTHTVAGIPISGHFLDGLKVYVAPAMAFSHGASEFMIRGGVGYDFVVDGIYITPMVSVDYLFTSASLSAVYGIALGASF